MPRTPDIPQNIFFQEKEPSTPKKAPVADQETAQSHNDKVTSSQGDKTAKVQVTVYLSEETAKELEWARFELLSKHNVKVPKSAIAEYAITMATLDIEAMASALGGGK